MTTLQLAIALAAGVLIGLAVGRLAPSGRPASARCRDLAGPDHQWKRRR